MVAHFEFVLHVWAEASLDTSGEPYTQLADLPNIGLYPLVNIQKTMENHRFKWVNQLFLWLFSIAILT